MALSSGPRQPVFGIGPLIVAAVLAGGAVMLVGIPLPALVVDLLLAANLAAAVVLLTVALVSPRPVELSAFPTVIVLTSLARILLCLAVGRLIVTAGQAGGLATTLAQVAALNNPVASLGTLVTVGIVQFIVVTAGVGRLAEVGARFALDALPGKQLALDSAFSGQRISEAESHQRATRLEAEANFYGAMDGAARFLRGETVAILVIVALTPVVRLLTGALSPGAGSDLALLIAGHGLIILLPALLSGAAAAVMVARAGSASPLIAEVTSQFLQRPGPVVAAAAACLLLALVPGMAKLPLLMVAVGLGVWGWLLMRGKVPSSEAETAPESEAAPTAGPVSTTPQILVGWGLLDLLTDGRAQFLEELAQLRCQLSSQLGFALPAFTIRDSSELGVNEYSFVFRGSTVGRGEAHLSRRLAVGRELEAVPPVGLSATFPDGRPAAWVTPEQEHGLAANDWELLTARQAILTHLRRTLRQHAAELFDIQRATEVIDALRPTHPAVVAEAEELGLTASLLAGVGQELLKKGLPVADYLSLIEALTEGLKTTTDVRGLSDAARRAMQGTNTQLLAPKGVLYALQLSADVEERLTSVAGSQQTTEAVLPPEQAAAWRQLLANLVARYRRPQHPIALLCSSQVRRVLEQVAIQFVPDLVIIEPDEVLGNIQIYPMHQISADQLSTIA